MINNKPITGVKMYRYDEDSDTPEIIRILNIDYDKDILKFRTESGEKKKESYKKIKSSYKILAPDGMIYFSKVKVGADYDVIVALQPYPKTEKGWEDLKGNPYVVCRQMAADIFSNMLDPDNMIIGVTISKDTCPPNVDYTCMLGCDSMEYSKIVAVYMDDTLDNILSLFDNKIFDEVFTSLESKYGHLNGYCHNLKELLESNNFMFDFRRCFKITEVPFEISTEDIEYGELDIQNTKYLEQELKTNIKKTYLVKYSRDIDFSRIKRKYIFIASAKENYANLYLLGYDEE